MDFEWNKKNIIESIKQAKEANCTIRLGPELEITSYDCEDHFHELDTVTHSWEVIAEILSTDLTVDILCDFGMPVIYKNSLYNSRVICLNKKIILVRPKIWLAEDAAGREARWFTPWLNGEYRLEEMQLPGDI